MGARIRRLAAFWADLWAIAGGLVLLAIVLVTSTNVAAFAADRVAGVWGGVVPGLPGYEDFVRLTIGCAALMFFPHAQARRGHVAVDIFVDYLPERLRHALDRAWLVLTIALALFLAGWMGVGMMQAKADALVTGVLGWPDWPFYIPGMASLVLWAVVAATQLGDPV